MHRDIGAMEVPMNGMKMPMRQRMQPTMVKASNNPINHFNFFIAARMPMNLLEHQQRSVGVVVCVD
eukprot:1803061-Rhodomonas_salina.1